MSKLVRFQAEVSKTEFSVLEEVQNACGFRNKRELLNNALSIIVWVVHELSAGRSIQSVDERTNERKELSMPFFASVRHRQTEHGSIGGSDEDEVNGKGRPQRKHLAIAKR